MTGYTIVIPRDLFNEAKLLKCWGQLALMIHDGRISGLRIEHDSPENGFVVVLEGPRGGISCPSLSLWKAGEIIHLYCPANSRSAYPMQFVYESEAEGDVFNDDGSPSAEFKAYIGMTW